MLRLGGNTTTAPPSVFRRKTLRSCKRRSVRRRCENQKGCACDASCCQSGHFQRKTATFSYSGRSFRVFYFLALFSPLLGILIFFYSFQLALLPGRVANIGSFQQVCVFAGGGG